jgi:hypothetical protein
VVAVSLNAAARPQGGLGFIGLLDVVCRGR